MKILHVCQFLGVGGLEKVLYSLIKEQVKLGHVVEVVVYDHDRRWVDKYRNELNIQVHTGYDKKPGYDTGLLSYLALKVKNFDIIHTHDLNPMLYIGVIKLIRPRLKIIHTTHGMEHLDTHPKTRVYEVFLGIVSKCIIAVSPKFKTYYQSQLFTNKNKVHLIDNGTEINNEVVISPDQMLRDSVFSEFNLDPAAPTGIYVARVVPLKAQIEIIEHFNKTNQQLLIVGPSGDDSYYKKCENILGPTTVMTNGRSDITRLLKACDYFISPSLHEGLPIAVLEAGAQGLPCLLYNIPGHTTFNEDKECVLIYNDTNDLNQSIEHVLNNKEELVKNFTDLIKKKYSSQSMAIKYLEYYQEALC